MAAEAGAPKIVEQLLKKAKTLGITADLVNALDSQNCHALLLAAKTGEPETVKLLVERTRPHRAGDDLRQHDRAPARVAAWARQGGRSDARLRGDDGGDHQLREADGFNALMLGALMGQTAAVRVLLAAKADPNFQFKAKTKN